MTRLTAVLAAIALTSSVAFAAPKKKAARAEFDRGVAAYTQGDFAAAADALGKSYALEADAETLFAWAQTERKLDRCDKAIDLYDKLLATKGLPDENKEAVRVQIEECNAIIAAQKPASTPDAGPESSPDTPPDSADAATADTSTTAIDAGPRAQPQTDGPRTWWKDPVGGTLVGLGLVGIGVGTVFMIQGSGADSDKDNAATYDEFMALDDKAESKGRIGVIGLAAGGALIVGGVIWYATRGSSKSSEKTVSGWLSPESSGLVVTGRF